MAVTFTIKLHDAFAFNVAPLRLTLEPPAVAAIVPPPQDPVRPLGVAITKPLGRLSVNPTPLSAAAFATGFTNVKLRVVVPLMAMLAAPNVFAIVGGAMMVTLADAVPPVPPSVDVTAPVVLFRTPADVPVTLTEKVHEAPAARVAPERVMLLDPGAALIVPPPQVPVNPLGEAT